MKKEFILFLEDELIGSFDRISELMEWIRKTLHDAEVGHRIIIEVAEKVEY